MRILVASAFRDSGRRAIARWVKQVQALERRAEEGLDEVSALAVEGDSIDPTKFILEFEVENSMKRGRVVKQDFGGPRFGSTEDPQRMYYLSLVLNGMLDEIPDSIDVVLRVESDLIWDPDTALALCQLADSEHCVIAPLIFAGAYFYDIWAFRKDRERFSSLPPYHPKLGEGLTRVDSAGSCLAIPGDIARRVRVNDGNALVGWCDAARESGASIMVAPWLRVEHPA